MVFKKLPLKIYIPLLSLGFLLTFLLILLFSVRNSITKHPEIIKPSDTFCIEGFFFLPQLYKIDTSIPLETEINAKTKLFEIDILSREICFKPTALLEESKVYTVNLAYLSNNNMNIFQNEIELSADKYPSILETSFENEISRNQVLTFTISYNSSLIDYLLVIGEENILCKKENTLISCNTQDIPFEYGQMYPVKLLSTYKGEVIKTVYTKDINILYPVIIESSSIGNHDVIQTLNIPEITLTLNKEVTDSFNIIFEDSEKTPISHTYTIKDNTIVIQPQESFKQNSTYFIKVSNLEGTDGSKAESEYILEFSVGDGPKVKGSNMKAGFPVGDSITLTFNQDLKTGQNIKNFIKLTPYSDYSYTIKRNQITINPTATLNSCVNYKLEISKGMAGANDLIASKGSLHTFKTRCYRVINIGTSVEGRSIYAYYFGNGSKKILFFGAMHGSEANTQTTMTKWIDELETNSGRIPSDKTIIVIPTLNPDGIANKSRFNANGVDLNRNFAASDWTQETYLHSNFYPTGGGAYPFSEPESIVMRDLILREKPYISLSYHAAASYVIASNTARAIQLGQIYAQLSGYKYVAPNTHDAFSYDITGTFEGWAEQQGYSSLVIELSSASSDQFIQNRNAMWRMVEEE